MIGLYLIQMENDRSLIVNKGDDSYLSDLEKYANWQYVVRHFDALARKTKILNRKIVLIGDSSLIRQADVIMFSK